MEVDTFDVGFFQCFKSLFIFTSSDKYIFYSFQMHVIYHAHPDKITFSLLGYVLTLCHREKIAFILQVNPQVATDTFHTFY